MTESREPTTSPRLSPTRRLPSVTIVCPNTSGNALGRALVLAEVLAGATEVQVLGAELSEGIWPPARGRALGLHAFPVRRVDDLWGLARWLRRHASGEVIVVSKPVPTSLGAVLLAGFSPRRIVLDVDDWEMGFFPSDGGLRGHLRDLANALEPRGLNTRWGTRLTDLLSPVVRTRTVSNRWLQARYGGVLLPHVRDPAALDPERAPATDVRAPLDLGGRPWVGFAGTVRPHKGVADLIAALGAFEVSPTAPGLLLLGADSNAPDAWETIAHAFRVLGPQRLRLVPPFPLEDLPSYLAIPDVIALPSRDSRASRGQLPAKLFDAMAMAKAIVATDVNDVAEVLGGSGLVVPPSDVIALTAALKTLLEDAALRRRLGAAARQRLVEHYNLDAGREVLARALREVVG